MSSLSILKSYLQESQLEFPTSRQSNTSSCGSAVVQSVLRYYGIDKREDDISRNIFVTKKMGSSPKSICRYLKSFDLKVQSGEMTIEDLIKNIDNKYPTIVLFQAWTIKKNTDYQNFSDGHYAVVIGYDIDNIIFEDPSLNNNKGYLSKDDFEKRWHGLGAYNKEIQNYGITVIGTPQYNPKSLVRID